MITYSLLCWMEDLNRKILGVITLGLIGVFSYFRPNVLLLYLAVLGLNLDHFTTRSSTGD